jgi:transcriptional regulator with GAF, ATPase, and Fis domain
MQAWWYPCGAACRRAGEALAAELAACGIELGAPSACAAGSAGLVLFEAVHSDVLDALKDLATGGATRIVALQTGGAALDGEQHWRLLAAGAADVLSMADTRPPTGIAATLAARLKRWAEVDAVLASPLVSRNLIGQSPAWRRVLRQVVELACFGDAGALIVGESGTGKELIARLIHTLDQRADKRELVVLDCSTLVPELAGSEFFGHERGAYTGATGPRDGAFALADGGTLFLDEVGELPLHLQPQLLRVVQERSFKRVGGSRWGTTQFRLVCATHHELREDVERGTFRADLYHRLAAVTVRLPPLRDRPQDILPLAHSFLAQAAPGRPPPEMQPPVRDYLLRRRFPGNVRELRQLMSRIAGRHVGDGPITVGDIPEDERPSEMQPAQDWRRGDFETAIGRALCQGVGLRDISQCAAEAAIRIALSEESGNLQRAAGRLGVTDRALQLRRAGRPGH